MRADDIGVLPTKLVISPRFPGYFKAVYLTKDTTAGLHKGTGADVGDIGMRLDISWDATTAAFLMPVGASDGTAGWVKNDDNGVKYVNHQASSAPGFNVKVAVLRTGRLLKIVMKGRGDVGQLDLSGQPAGPVSTCVTITNGSEVHRIGSVWPAGVCTDYQGIEGALHKIRCVAGGQPDSACSAAP